MTWIRVDTRLHRHPKLLALPSDGARWSWLGVLCEAKAVNGVWQNSAHFRANVGPKAARLLDDFLRVSLLERDGDCIKVHDWPSYQVAPDGTVKERVKRWRERQRNAVTSPLPPLRGNALLTEVKHDTRALDRDRDRDIDRENQRVVPSSGFARAATLVASLVKRDFNPEAGYGTTLRDDVADLGYEKVAAQLQVTVSQNGRTYDCASLVYTAHKALYPIGPGPSSKDVRDTEDAEKRQRRDAREAARLREYEAMIETRP